MKYILLRKRDICYQEVFNLGMTASDLYPLGVHYQSKHDAIASCLIDTASGGMPMISSSAAVVITNIHRNTISSVPLRCSVRITWKPEYAAVAGPPHLFFTRATLC